MDISRIREDFPIFQNQIQPFVYMDNGATAQKPLAVVERLRNFYLYENSNIHRGSYPLSSHASNMYEKARECIRDWIDAEYADEIVFTKGSTEAINLAACALFEAWVRPGDNVIVTELEHSSNFFPWKHWCERSGADFHVAEADKDGSLDAQAVLSLIDGRTKLVAVTAMSNVTGFRPSLDIMIREAHRQGARVLVDASQEIVHQTVSVNQMECDFLCFSGHKLYGPMGTGVLYGKREYLKEMPPYLYGGDMVEKGDTGIISYKTEPGKFEAGTQNIAGILGLEAAITYLKEQGFDSLVRYEAELSVYARKRLGQLDGIHILGPDIISPVITLEAEHLGAYDLGVLLANRGIAVRCGAHCAYPLIRRMGKESICRISLAIYNTREEIDYMAEALEDILGGFNGNCRGGKRSDC